MFEVHIKGFNTKAEAESFVDWYSASGEQDAVPWFESQKDNGVIETDFMGTDCSKTYPTKWKDNVIDLVLKMSY